MAKKSTQHTHNDTEGKPAQKKSSLSLLGILNRFHVIIFALCIGGGLSAAVFLLYQTVENTSAPKDYTPTTTNTTFDLETAERLRELRPLSEAPVAPEPGQGRSDPLP